VLGHRLQLQPEGASDRGRARPARRRVASRCPRGLPDWRAGLRARSKLRAAKQGMGCDGWVLAARRWAGGASGGVRYLRTVLE